MKQDNKYFYVLILVATILVIIFAFLMSSYISSNRLKHTPFPHINTFELPVATVGTEYRADIYTSLISINGDLFVSADGLPNGLILGDCSQTYDTNLIPSNTQTKCYIGGVPTQEGISSIKISASHQDMTIEKEFSIKVVSQEKPTY